MVLTWQYSRWSIIKLLINYRDPCGRLSGCSDACLEGVLGQVHVMGDASCVLFVTGVLRRETRDARSSTCSGTDKMVGAYERRMRGAQIVRIGKSNMIWW